MMFKLLLCSTFLILQVTGGPQLIVFGGTDDKGPSIKVTAYDAQSGDREQLKEMPLVDVTNWWTGKAYQNAGMAVGERNAKYLVLGGHGNAGRGWTIEKGALKNQVPAMGNPYRSWPVIQWIDNDKVLVCCSGRNYEIYNSQDNSWGNKTTINFQQNKPVGVVYNDDIYILMGHRDEAFAKYIKTTDQFEKLTAFPLNVWGFGAAVLGDKLVACGGETWRAHWMDPQVFSKECKAYDFPSKKWEEFPSLNVARTALTMAATGGNVYALGGWATVNTVVNGTTGPKYTTYKTVEKYDKSAKKWVVMPYKLDHPVTQATVIGVPSLTPNIWYK